MHRRRFLALAAAAGAAPAAGTDALAEHRLASVAFRRVRQPWPRLVGKNSRLDVHGRGPTVGVAVLRTDQGATGWGMAKANAQQVAAYQELVKGRKVSELISAASGILAPQHEPFDIPLHDLAAVILGQPVWKMLGAQQPAANKIYSGMIYFDDLEPPDQPAGIDQVLANCRHDHDLGYRQLKVKIGRGAKWMPRAAGLRRDIEVVRAIHEAFPDCELLVDGNDGFTADSIVAFLGGIEGIPLFWIEEPFRETLRDWRRLKQWTSAHGRAGTYLADGEAAPDFEVLETLEAEGTLNLRLNDILDYGFTAWRKLMPRLAAQKVAASPHAWGAGLKTVYAAHLGAALGNTPTIEGVTCGDIDVDFGGHRIRDGRYHLSSAPGFGLTLRNP